MTPDEQLAADLLALPAETLREYTTPELAGLLLRWAHLTPETVYDFSSCC